MEQNQSTPPQVNLNLHKQRLYCLIAAGVALVSLLLPWVTVSLGGFGGGSVNGFRSWGLLSLLGVGAVAAASFMGNKSLPYDENLKKIAMGGFGGIALGALIFFFRISSYGGGFGGVSSGFGLWLCLVAGLAGLAFIMGFIKIPEKK
jgi:hypothetical protein